MGKFLWVKFMKSLTQIDLVYVNYLKKDSETSMLFKNLYSAAFFT